MADPAQPDTVPTTAESSGPPRQSSARARVLNLVLLAVIDVGLAILAFEIVKSATGSSVLAYLAASIGPLLGGLIQFLRSRSFSGVSALILVFTVASAAAAMIGGTDERLLLVKDSVVTGVFGLVFLISLVPGVPRPLAYYFGQRFATDGTERSIAWWDGLWRYPQFRASQRQITVVWGAIFVGEAILRVLAAYTIPFDAAFAVSTVLPIIAFALAMTLTFVIAGRARRAGEKAAASSLTDATAVAHSVASTAEAGRA